MTDFDKTIDRFGTMTEEERSRAKAAEPGGGGGPNSKYFSGAKQDFHVLGTTLFGEELKEDTSGKLREEFIFPPFTVLNAREGPWQDRKKAWLSCGIKSEVGRGENLLQMSDTLLEPDPVKRAAMQASRGGLTWNVTDMDAMRNREAKTFDSGGPGTLAEGFKAKSLNTQEWVKKKIEEGEIDGGLSGNQTGTSIFDPVLTELCYRWFCPAGGQIVDPFAGGSVRGVVAGLLGFKYHGIDLRPEQIAANEQQRRDIAPDADIHWVVGDSNERLLDAPAADLVFSCPPYFDLEQYSDKTNDLSNMTWNQFVKLYMEIIQKAVNRLKPNRFAVFVVGEVRDQKTGLYRGFVPLTCAAFMAAGASLYNEAILITAVGSLPIRVTKQFETSRKLGRTHQNVLCFVKGDPKIAAQAIQNPSAVTTFLPPRQIAPKQAEEGLKREPGPSPIAEGLSPPDRLPEPSPEAPSALDFAIAQPEEPVVERTAHVIMFSTPDRSGGSLADFLGTRPIRSEPEWKAEPPPSLDGIDSIILNFATDGLEWTKGAQPVGLTVSTLDGKMTRFMPFAFQGGGNLDPEQVKRFLEQEVRGKHILNGNTRFDMHMSRTWGVDLDRYNNTFSDIMHTAALLDDHRKRFALDVLAKDFLPGHEVVDRLDERNHAQYAAYEVAQREVYTAQVVGKLREVMYPELEKQDLLEVQKIEDNVIPAVVEMEKNGSKLDLELLEKYHSECTKRHEELMLEISREVGFAFEHSAAGWQRLFEYHHMTPSEDGYAENIISAVDHPMFRKAQFASQLASLNSKTFAAYKKQIGADGLLYYDINQLRGDEGGTVSGRFSIGYVQQVPNKGNHSLVFGDELFPRRLFIADEGDYLEADAAQIEYRLFAHYANNPTVIEMYRRDPTISFHRTTHDMMLVHKPDMIYEHQKNFNFACVAVDTPILTADLRWVRAGDLRPDDRLLAIDEHRRGNTAGRASARRWQLSTVLHNHIEEKQCAELTMENGDRMIATLDHPWICFEGSAKRGHGNTPIWRTTNRLVPGDRLAKYISPWSEDKSWEAGWLAGFFDGEGCTSNSSVTCNQNEGLLLEFAHDLLKTKTNLVNRYWSPYATESLQVAGSVHDRLDFLGRIRPRRLIDNFVLGLHGHMAQTEHKVKVLSMRPIGLHPIAALETTSFTYLANGYGSHNTMYGARSIKLAVMMGFISQREGDEIRAEKRWNDPRLDQIKEIETAYKQIMPESQDLLDRASHLAMSECSQWCNKRDKLHKLYPHRGYVKTLCGRRSRFPSSYKTYIGLNRVLQGTASDVMKKKLAELHRERAFTQFLMRMTVHDQVGGDARTPETKTRVSEILNHQSFPQVQVPIIWEVGTGRSWADCKGK